MGIFNREAVRRTIVALGLAVLAGPLVAEEGMWTFHGVPTARIQKAYGWAPDQKWLDHQRLSAMRLEDGGSSSVYRNGLLMTNHHVALEQLHKASREGKDYVKNGFGALTQAEELPTEDLEINVLTGMEDVTARVAGAIKKGAGEAEANEQRKAEISRIEKEATDEANNVRAEVIKFYEGGEYWLYRYKKYTDVRLVMAPEAGAAAFGSNFREDPDNFTFPRYDFDKAFFRVYENGKPVQFEHHLTWSAAGAKEGELVFTVGHPGKTERLKTLSQLQTIKDVQNPHLFDLLTRRREALLAYADQGPEQARQAQAQLFGVNNSRKVYQGRLQALNNPEVLAIKEREEQALRGAVEKDPALREAYGKAWDRIANVTRLDRARFPVRRYRQLGGGGDLVNIANHLVRHAEEASKPNEKRWAEYRDSALESLRKNVLFSPSPIYPELEKILLASNLQASLEKLGKNDHYVKKALKGKTPKEAAEAIVSKTRLLDVEYRKELFKGGQAAIDASDDPLIRLAADLSLYYRAERTWYEKTVEAVEVAAGALIAKARFAVYGKTSYPDATFTLRLSYGKVAGYEEGTTRVPYKTTFYGLYGRAADFDNKTPFDLPEKVAAAEKKVNLSTPLNFVTTNDIIGGNSGSPVVNKAGELVGLIFDGNIQSLEGDFVYREAQNRAVAVHSSAILEALVNIYDMPGLAAELTGKTVEEIKKLWSKAGA